MPDQLSKGHTFVDGDTVDGASLNALVDEAIALKGLVIEQIIATPDAANDYIQFYDASAAALKRCLIQSLPTGINTFSMTMPTAVFNVNITNPTGPTTLVDVSFDGQSPNKVFAAPASGGTGTPTFRLLVPPDMANLLLIPALDIDCNLASAFYKAIGANSTLQLLNGTAGQTIWVRLSQTGAANFVLNWNAPGKTIRWPGGVQPGLTSGTASFDIFEFFYDGNTFFGTAARNFLP